MKHSSNSISMWIFIILATAVFALMVLRPAVDVSAMNLGVPMESKMASSSSMEAAPVEEVVEKVETESATTEAEVKDEMKEATEEATPKTDDSY